MPSHLYIHLPFCRSRCHYCAFPSVAVDVVPEKKYLAALLAEFRFRQKRWSGKVQPLSTLYFGGGTPSLFSPAFFSSIIDFFTQETGFTADSELTLEANPADIRRELISGYVSAGINRISLGAQTFSARGLRLLGRRHNVSTIERAVAIIRQAKVENLSLDLIYAWPGQSCDDFLADLQSLTILGPEHVSAYSLSFEPGCSLTEAVAAKKLVPVNEDLQLEMMRLLEVNLDKAGLYRYEVSNFSRGYHFQSRHNLAYWQLKDFIGLGAGACGGRRSRISPDHWAERYCNTSDPTLYMQHYSGADSSRMGARELLASPDCEEEVVDLSGSFAEALMMGLRLRVGVNLVALQHEYGRNMVADVISRAQHLAHEGMVGLEGNRLWITDRGLYLTDAITNRLL